MRLANPESMNSVVIPKEPERDSVSSTLGALASSFGMGMAGPNAIDAQTGGRMLQSWGNDLSALGQTTGLIANSMFDGTALKLAGQAIRNPGETAQALGHGILETANLYGAGFGDAEFDLGRGFQYAGEHPFSTYLLLDGLMSGKAALSRLADYGTREALNAAMRSPISSLKDMARRYALNRYNMDEWARPAPPEEPYASSALRLIDEDPPNYPWATHPSVKKRVERLDDMARNMDLDIDMPLDAPRLPQPQRVLEPLPDEPRFLDDLIDDADYDPVLHDIDRIQMMDPEFSSAPPAEPYQQLYSTNYSLMKQGANDLKDQIWHTNNGSYRNPETDFNEIRSLSDVLRLSWVFANLFGANTMGGWSPQPYMDKAAKKIWKTMFGDPLPF